MTIREAITEYLREEKRCELIRKGGTVTVLALFGQSHDKDLDICLYDQTMKVILTDTDETTNWPQEIHIDYTDPELFEKLDKVLV